MFKSAKGKKIVSTALYLHLLIKLDLKNSNGGIKLYHIYTTCKILICGIFSRFLNLK